MLTEQFLVYAAQSVAGRVRAHNEDAVLCQPRLGLWAVADGMGGHQCGEVASALALKQLQQAIETGSDLEQAIHAANRAILAAVQEEGGRRMGSTLVAVRIAEADFEVAWVGDSRAYRISLDGIERLSRDPTFRQFLALCMSERTTSDIGPIEVRSADPDTVALAAHWLRRLSNGRIDYRLQFDEGQDVVELVRTVLHLSPRARVPQIVIERVGDVV